MRCSKFVQNLELSSAQSGDQCFTRHIAMVPLQSIFEQSAFFKENKTFHSRNTGPPKNSGQNNQ
jgi:hypothetical protein